IEAAWAPADVAAIAKRAAPDVAISGSAAVSFDWRGTRDRLSDGQGSLRFERADVTLGSQRFQLAQAGRIDADRNVVRVTPIVITSGRSRITVDGAPATAATPQRAALTLDGSLADFAFVRRLTQTAADAGSETWPLAGSIRARISAEGALSDPR